MNVRQEEKDEDMIRSFQYMGCAALLIGILMTTGCSVLKPGADVSKTDTKSNTPVIVSVAQNIPNPFKTSTTIGLELDRAGDVSVEVFTVTGKKIDTLVEGYMEAGSQSVVWDATGFPAGVYFYTVQSIGFTKTMKMTHVQ